MDRGRSPLTTAIILLVLGMMLSVPSILLWRPVPDTPLDYLAFQVLGVVGDLGQAVLAVGAMLLGLVVIGRLTGVLPVVRREGNLLWWGIGLVLLGLVLPASLAMLFFPVPSATSMWGSSIVQILMVALAAVRLVGCLLLAGWLLGPAPLRRGDIVPGPPTGPGHGIPSA